MAEQQQPVPATTVPPAIRVHITWDAARNVPSITSTHPLPAKALVLAQLTPAQRKLVPSNQRKYTHYDTEDCISGTHNTIPLQVWSDAIGAATIQGLACAGVSAETEMSSISQGGYLAIGDSIYKMSAVGHVSSNKAMAALKRNIADKARAKAEAVVAAANQAAATIATNAAQMREQAEELLEQARRNCAPPRAFAERGCPLRYVDGKWLVGLTARIALTHFEFEHSYTYRDSRDRLVNRTGRKSWQAVDGATPSSVLVLCWVRIDNITTGDYVQTGITTDRACTQLPHINNVQGCMELSGAPPHLLTFNHLDQLRVCIERAMRGVTLHSLLTHPLLWLPAFKQFVPADLLAILQDREDYKERLRELIISEGEALEVDRVQEATEVWHAEPAR